MESLENQSGARPKKFQHDFQSIYYFSRCIGLWPFTIEYNSNGPINAARVHLFDCLWFLIAICLYLTALLYSLEHTKSIQNVHEKYFFWNYIYKINHYPSLSFGTVCIVLNMLNRKRLVNILNKFAFFDQKVCILQKRN